MEFYNIKKELKLTDIITLTGFSRGALRTGFIIYPYKIFLDSGIPFQVEPSLILITHGHQDHVDAIYSNLMNNEKKKIEVIASKNLIWLLQDHLNSCKSVNVGKKSIFNNWTPLCISPLIKNHDIIINNNKILIEAYYLEHEVESLGYGVSEIRNKLLEIYKDKTKKELIEIKKVYKLTEEKKIPILFFCGDTNNTILSTLPFNDFPIFIIEATFLDDKHINDAYEKKHMHINDLKPYFINYPKTKFILIHFSLKYKIEEIKAYQKIFSIYENVIFWI